MSYNLCGDRVILDPDPDATESKGGIAYSQRTNAVSAKATVVAVGPGRVTKYGDRVPMRLQPGQRVHFNPSKGLDICVDGRTCLVMAESDVLAILDGEKEPGGV